MVNKKFWLGILVIALVFGMTVVGCDDGSTDGDGGENAGGTFVLTDIPTTYEGQYVLFSAEDSNVNILGFQSVNMSTETITLPRISNGKAIIPLWIATNTDPISISRYYGNDTFTQDDRWGFLIFDKARLTDDILSNRIATIYFSGSVVFKNGYAEKSVNNGTVIQY
jgi:hypothetical protein